MTIKQIEVRKRTGLSKPAPPFNPHPDKGSNRSRKRKNRGFISLEKSSRKHKRATDRVSRSSSVGQGVKAKGYQDYHS